MFYDGLFRVKEEQNPFFYNFSTNLTIISNDTTPANKTKYNYDAVGRITSVMGGSDFHQTPDGDWVCNTCDDEGYELSE